jgi:methionyl-tRNA synthetase
MVDRYLGGVRPIGDAADEASAVALAAARLPSLVAHHLERFAFDDALRSIWEAVSLGNRHINAMEPWKLAKAAVDAADSQDRELAQRQLVTCLADLIDLLLTIATSLAPFLPATSATMSRQLSGKVATRGARSDHRSQPRQILFPRLTGRP